MIIFYTFNYFCCSFLLTYCCFYYFINFISYSTNIKIIAPFILFDPFIFSHDLKILIGILGVLIISRRIHKHFSFYGSSFTSILLLYSSFFPREWFIGEGFSLLVITLFFAFSNLISLFAYGFTPLSHLSLTWVVGLFLWIRVIFWVITLKSKRKLGHYAPLGTPIWLLPLLISVEIVREIIRPITLSVRLAANLTAGHIILFIASSSSFISFFPAILLFLLETLVALVQPLVFLLLCSLYSREA